MVLELLRSEVAAIDIKLRTSDVRRLIRSKEDHRIRYLIDLSSAPQRHLFQHFCTNRRVGRDPGCSHWWHQARMKRIGAETATTELNPSCFRKRANAALEG